MLRDNWNRFVFFAFVTETGVTTKTATDGLFIDIPLTIYVKTTWKNNIHLDRYNYYFSFAVNPPTLWMFIFNR